LIVINQLSKIVRTFLTYLAIFRRRDSKKPPKMLLHIPYTPKPSVERHLRYPLPGRRCQRAASSLNSGGSEILLKGDSYRPPEETAEMVLAQ